MTILNAFLANGPEFHHSVFFISSYVEEVLQSFVESFFLNDGGPCIFAHVTKPSKYFDRLGTHSNIRIENDR